MNKKLFPEIIKEEDEMDSLFDKSKIKEIDKEYNLKINEINQIKMKFTVYFNTINIFVVVFLFFYVIYFFLEVIRFVKNRVFIINSVRNNTIL